MSIQEGQNAPDFSLTDNHGNTVSLDQLRGKYVVLYFYPRDDTPGCTKEACGFRDLSEDFKKCNTVVIGVSPDNTQSHQKFVEKYHLPFTLLCDPDRAVMEQYGAYGEKMMYGKTTMGVIRSTAIIGPDGVIVKHWKRVPKAADHPAKVLEVVQKLSV